MNIGKSYSSGPNSAIIDENAREIGTLVYYSPTANCQMCSLADACILIEDFEVDEVVDVLKKITSACGKRLILMDLNKGTARIAREWFYKAIILDSSYTSTNRSKMVIMIIDVTKLGRKKLKPKSSSKSKRNAIRKK